MQGTFQPSFIEIGPGVYEMSFEQNFYGRTDARRKVVTKSHLENVVLMWAKNCEFVK